MVSGGVLAGSYKLITFNCYGTLIDWMGGIRQGLSSLLADAGVSVSTERLFEAYLQAEAELEKPPWRPYAHVLQEAAVRIGKSCGFEVNHRTRRALVDSLPTWAPFPDTNAALKRLKRRYKLAILSNIDRDLMARTVEHFEVEFDWVVTAEDVRAYKPAPNHFQHICDLSGYGPADMLHAAQSLHHDIVPCTSMGRACAWINRGAEANNTEAVPTAEFPNLSALADSLGL